MTLFGAENDDMRSTESHLEKIKDGGLKMMSLMYITHIRRSLQSPQQETLKKIDKTCNNFIWDKNNKMSIESQLVKI